MDPFRSYFPIPDPAFTGQQFAQPGTQRQAVDAFAQSPTYEMPNPGSQPVSPDALVAGILGLMPGAGGQVPYGFAGPTRAPIDPMAGIGTGASYGAVPYGLAAAPRAAVDPMAGMGTGAAPVMAPPPMAQAPAQAPPPSVAAGPPPSPADPLAGLMATANAPLFPTGLDKLAAGLAGFGAGLQGRSNPVMQQALQEREQKLRQQIELTNVRLRIAEQRQRQDTQMAEIGFRMLAAGGPAAKMGGEIVTKFLSKAGYQVPRGLADSLSVGTVTATDITDIQRLKLNGVPVDEVVRSKPKLAPSLVRSVYEMPLTDDARKMLGLPTKAEQDLKDVQIKKTTQDLLAGQHPELELDPKLGAQIEIAHLKATRKHYIDGDKASQAAAVAAGEAAYNEQKMQQAALMAGVRAGEHIHSAPMGGYIHDRQTNRDVTVIKDSDRLLEPTRYIDINADQKKTIELMRRGILAEQRLKAITPLVLASVPRKTLLNALEKNLTRLVGGSPLLNDWLFNVNDAAIENARSLGGGGQLRVTLLKLLQKDLSAQLSHDTVRSAMTMIDLGRLNMENQIRGLHMEPQIGLSRRFGPGKYLAIDRRDGKRKVITVPANMLSPEEFDVLEPM